MWAGFWPLYVAALGASPLQIGLLLALQSLLGPLFVLSGGPASDRFSARALLTAGWSLLAAGLVLVVVAQRWWQLLPAIFVMAIGRAAFPVVDAEIAAQARSAEERTRAFTLIWTFGPAAASLATPAIGGALATRFGLRSVFLGAAVPTLIAAAIFRTLKSAAPASRRDAGPRDGYLPALRERSIRVVCILSAALSLAVALRFALLPNYLHTVHGLTLAQIGWIGSAGAAGSVAIAFFAAHLRPLQRVWTGLGVTLTLVTVGLGLLLLGNSIAAFVVGSFLAGASLLAEATLGSLMAEAAPAPLRARAFALGQLASGAAFGAGPVIAGALYARDPRLPLVASLLLVLSLLGLSVWRLWPPSVS